jgi:hypothetical protein
MNRSQGQRCDRSMEAALNLDLGSKPTDTVRRTVRAII